MLMRRGVEDDLRLHVGDHTLDPVRHTNIGDDRAQRAFADLRWNYYRWPDDNTIDHPSSVAEHIAWLEAAGFAAVELHWLQAGHAIFSARKPSA